MDDDRLKESVRKLLFEQHKSALSAFDSSQDSLNKAFTAILFAEIAFYITKVTPLDKHILLDSLVMFYMVGSLMIVLILFAKSKIIARLLSNVIELEIFSVDTKNPMMKQEIANQRKQKFNELGRHYRVVTYINRQIPITIAMSSIACFTKVCTNDYWLNSIIVVTAFVIYVIISLVILFFIDIEDFHHAKKII